MLETSYAAESGPAVTSEFISLLFIVGSFILIAYLNFKLRNLRTFQFDMLAFIVVLAAAEIPRTLYSLGVIDLDWLSTAGLAIHSASMAVLSFFVAYRIYGFFRGAPVTALKGSYEELIVGSVDRVMTQTFGANVARAVDFYIDRNIALTDPVNYERALGKMFGAGSKILRDAIIDSVSQGAGIEKTSVSTFEEAWAAAKSRLAGRK